MTQNNTKSIVRLSANEINSVSGGRLPMKAVIAIGVIGASTAEIICPGYGALMALGILTTRITGLIFIVGNKHGEAFRKGVYTEIMAVAGLLGLKLQKPKSDSDENK